MTEIPTLYVCNGDDGGARIPPVAGCRRPVRPNGTIITHSKAILSWISWQS